MNGHHLRHSTPPLVSLALVSLSIATFGLGFGVVAERRERERLAGQAIALNARVAVLESEVEKLSAIFEHQVNAAELAAAIVEAVRAKEAEAGR